MTKMHKLIILFFILLLSTSIAGQSGDRSLKGKLVAFVNVNVIPMDRERVLKNHTVMVKDGKIIAIIDSKQTKVPAGAQIVDGTGKFLIPGLMDMHVHLFSDDEFPDALAEDEFKVMIAYGVTTIRFMIGTPEQLILREKSAEGEILAPTIFSASPHLTGRKQPNGIVVRLRPKRGPRLRSPNKTATTSSR